MSNEMFDKIFGSYNNRILTKNHIKTETKKKFWKNIEMKLMLKM
jgi:hypothetical protein